STPSARLCGKLRPLELIQVGLAVDPKAKVGAEDADDPGLAVCGGIAAMDSPQMVENRLDSMSRDWLPLFGEDPAGAVPIPPGGLPQERDARNDRRWDLLHRLKPVLEETILDFTYPVPLVLKKE